VLRTLAGTSRLPVSGLLIWLLIPGALLAGKLERQEKNTLLWAAVLAAGVLPFFITARFRLPIVPFMVIFLVPRVLKNTGRSLLLGSAGVAAGLFIAWVTAGAVEAGGVNMAFHDGVAHFQQGDLEGAEVLLLEAVDVAFSRAGNVDLNGVDALFNLGVISIRRGDTESAALYWEKAVSRDPGYTPARQALAGLTR
jgi:tetratricopeptide (TPR) repeat protein